MFSLVSLAHHNSAAISIAMEELYSDGPWSVCVIQWLTAQNLSLKFQRNEEKKNNSVTQRHPEVTANQTTTTSIMIEFSPGNVE